MTRLHEACHALEIFDLGCRCGAPCHVCGLVPSTPSLGSVALAVVEKPTGQSGQPSAYVRDAIHIHGAEHYCVLGVSQFFYTAWVFCGAVVSTFSNVLGALSLCQVALFVWCRLAGEGRCLRARGYALGRNVLPPNVPTYA